MDQKYFYNRKLPHWQPAEGTFFVTYRLAGSLPVQLINSLKENYTQQKNNPENQTPERKEAIRGEYFLAFENELEKKLNEPYWLKEDEVANLVLNSLLFKNHKQYTLWAACIMSNHVHVLLSLLSGASVLSIILQNHKKFTAVHSNKLLNHQGSFWAEESFDILIRNNEHFFNTVFYILHNPVKAGMVKNWKDYKWTYLYKELEKEYLVTSKIE